MPHPAHIIALLALAGGPLLLGHAPARTGTGDKPQRPATAGHKELKEIHRLSTPAGTWQLLEGPGPGGELPGHALYIRPLADSTSMATEMAPWHLPGRLLDGHNAECYYEAEVFVGEVLRDTIGVIWYDRSLMPDGHWKENTLLLDLGGSLPDTLVWFGHGRKSSTQGLAFGGKCILLNGRDQQAVVE